MSNKNEQPVIKRTRGRPKNKTVSTVLKHGIVTKPTLSNTIMELQYHIPLIFKKVFNLFEQIKIHDLKIEFKNEYILIKTIDNVEKNIILLTINCKEMISYYCKFDFEINIDSSTLQRLLKKIDKSYTTICLYSSEENYNNELNVILFRSDYKMKEKHIIKLIDINSMEDRINSIRLTNDYLKYPIQFELNSKFFKNLINDMNDINDEFTIEKKFNCPLTFKYKNIQSKLISKNIFKGNNEIKLLCTQEPGDIYGNTIYTTQIKPISSNLLSDNISIYLKQDKDVVFRINIEQNTFTFLIYSQIKQPTI